MTKTPPQPDFTLTGKDGKPIEIPLGGSLDLLALGDLGLLAWRQKREQVKSGTQ